MNLPKSDSESTQKNKKSDSELTQKKQKCKGEHTQKKKKSDSELLKQQGQWTYPKPGKERQ